MYLQRLLFCVVVLATVDLVVTARRMPIQYDSRKRYIKYVPGSLNVIITVSHGGDLRPSSIPDREAGCFINGQCVYRHNCGTPDENMCGVSTLKDRFVRIILICRDMPSVVVHG